MEIDVTHMVDDWPHDMPLVGSIAELGANAGPMTWRNSVAYGKEHPLLTTDEQREEARVYFQGFGAWTEEEIAAWGEDELQGITVQDVAHSISEMEVAEDYEDYQRLCENGTCSGNLYKGDNGRWYFYLGS